MTQEKLSKGNVEKDDISIFDLHRCALLDEQHWLYIQKHYHMSPRELQVAKLVCHGFNNEEISQNLKIKYGTVKTHIRNIYRRIRVNNKITMLLKFMNDAGSFSATSGNMFRIVPTEKPDGRTTTSSHMPIEK